MLWFFLFLLTFPSLVIRLTILHRNLPFRLPMILSYFSGICQDFFISFEQLFLFVLLKTLFPFLTVYLFWIFIALGSLLQLHLIFDAFLHRNSKIRMEISFFSFINDIRCFWDSAKEKKIWRFIPGALFFLLFPLFAYLYAWDVLYSLNFSRDWIERGLLFGVIGLIAFIFLPSKLSYAIDHIVFQNQIWFVQKFYRFFKRKNDRTGLQYLVKESFKPQNEKKSYLSSEYPLYKYTHGFTGEKTFDLLLNKEEKPHIILLFLESFRAKDVGCLGGKYQVTPYFDHLASKGILFSDFYANSVRTSRSVIASLFGVPSDVDASEQAVRVDFPFVGIPHLMKSKGYRSTYIHNGPIHFENQDLFFQNHGYETVLGQEDILKKFQAIHSTSWGLPDEYLMRYSIDFLKKHDNQPQLITLFTITNHHPWKLPQRKETCFFPSHLHPTYRKYLNTFHYSDAALGLFIDLLRKNKLIEKTLLFILGDHGYPMGEHKNNFVEQRFLYEENIRIPLLIYGEGRIKVPKVIDKPSSQLDLVPTIMDLFHLHGFNHSIGSSLLRETKTRPIFFHNPYVFNNLGLRLDKHKFIYTTLSNELELYDLKEDPGEKRNIARENHLLSGKCLQYIKDYRRLFQRVYGEKCFVPTKTYVTHDTRSLNFTSDP